MLLFFLLLCCITLQSTDDAMKGLAVGIHCLPLPPAKPPDSCDTCCLMFKCTWFTLRRVKDSGQEGHYSSSMNCIHTIIAISTGAKVAHPECSRITAPSMVPARISGNVLGTILVKIVVTVRFHGLLLILNSWLAVTSDFHMQMISISYLRKLLVDKGISMKWDPGIDVTSYIYPKLAILIARNELEVRHELAMLTCIGESICYFVMQWNMSCWRWGNALLHDGPVAYTLVGENITMSGKLSIHLQGILYGGTATRYFVLINFCAAETMFFQFPQHLVQQLGNTELKENRVRNNMDERWPDQLVLLFSLLAAADYGSMADSHSTGFVHCSLTWEGTRPTIQYVLWLACLQPPTHKNGATSMLLLVRMALGSGGFAAAPILHDFGFSRREEFQTANSTHGRCAGIIDKATDGNVQSFYRWQRSCTASKGLGNWDPRGLKLIEFPWHRLEGKPIFKGPLLYIIVWAGVVN